MTTMEVGSRIAVKNILIATDFSPCSNAALPIAAAIARYYEATLYAAHVWPDETDTPPMYTRQGCPPYETEDREARENLGDLEHALRGLPHHILMPRGNITTAICRITEERDIDLLVLGTHGRTGMSKLLVGSVAEEVFRRVTCPVLSVGPLVALMSDTVPEFRRIVFATDFSKESLAALPYAVSLAEENAAHLVLLHVIEQPRASFAQPHATMLALETRLRDLVPEEAELWCNVEARTVFGEPFAFPTDRILEVAHETSADLIVMGVRPVRVNPSLITHLPNTTAQILAEAPCPVLTVRS